MNQLQLQHKYTTMPDLITVRLNDQIIYRGNADIESIDFEPAQGINELTVTLDVKSPGNFVYNNATGQVDQDSSVKISELIVESRYFRSLVIKCGLVVVDLKKNLSFPSKYIDHENMITMEGSKYLIEFEYPIKNWMHIHKHGRNLEGIQLTNNLVREELKL